MEKMEIDFIIECLEKYREYYLAEDHGFCGTGPFMHCQAVASAIDKLRAAQTGGAPAEQTGNSAMDAIALLEECLTNGDAGPQQLFAWFTGERDIVAQTIESGQRHQ